MHFIEKSSFFLVIFMKRYFVFIDFDSKPTTLLRVDSLKFNKNLNHYQDKDCIDEQGRAKDVGLKTR